MWVGLGIAGADGRPVRDMGEFRASEETHLSVLDARAILYSGTKEELDHLLRGKSSVEKKAILTQIEELRRGSNG